MFTKVKGTYDLLPEESKKYTYIEDFLRNISTLYGFEEIRVPILSSAELIHRSNGDASDIVSKETYDFKDRGDRIITLRPEGTAPVIRSIIENKMYANYPLPLKVFYMGNMFRYERPQKGRYREFRQFGVEVVGTNSPYMDAEIIALAYNIFKELNIKNFRVRLNTLGDDESRLNYRNALKDYFKNKIDNLCEDCKRRYNTNPLRILDCKVDKDNEILLNAPKISDFLNQKSKDDFEIVKKYLDELEIPYVVDEQLVRGLDYYTNTIFELELTDTSNLGQAGTICGGGRYDNLTQELEGPKLGSIGFAFGLERLISIVDFNCDLTHKIDCQLIPIGEKAKINMIKMLDFLRNMGFISEMNYEATNLKGHFKSAENNKAKYLIIQGDDELSKNTVKIKNKLTNVEEEVNVSDLNELLDYLMESENKINSLENTEE